MYFFFHGDNNELFDLDIGHYHLRHLIHELFDLDIGHHHIRHLIQLHR